MRDPPGVELRGRVFLAKVEDPDGAPAVFSCAKGCDTLSAFESAQSICAGSKNKNKREARLFSFFYLQI